MMVAIYNFSMAFRLLVLLLFLLLNVVHAQDEGDGEPESGGGAGGGNGGDGATSHPANPIFPQSDSQEDVETPPCDADVDVAFIIDASTSVVSEDFKKEKGFVKKAAKKMAVEPGSDAELVTLSSQLRNESVRVFAVGIGNNVNEEELKRIAGDKNRVISASDFDKLDQKITQLINKACACPVDVAFIMDTSGSQENAFINEKEIVITLTKNMSIGATKENSRAALLHFGALAEVDGLFGTYATAAEFQTAVTGLPFLGKQTRIDRALELASREVFKKSSSSRPQIAIILTDGIQHSESQEVPKGLIEASRPLRNKGVRVIAVGITANTNEKRLRLMTEGNTDDVVVDKNKNVVINKVKLLLKDACKPLPRKVPGISTDCKDKLRHCASKAAKPNYCKNHPDYMAENCPKSCNFCPPDLLSDQ